MRYIVRVNIIAENMVPEYHEFWELEDAQSYADHKANELVKTNAVYDISIYEITNY